MSQDARSLQKILEDRKKKVQSINEDLDDRNIVDAVLAHFRLGEIVKVEDHPHPKAVETYYVVTVNLGDEEKMSCVQARREYGKDELLGMQVLVFEYSRRKVYGQQSEVRLLGIETDDETKPLSLLTTSRPAVVGNEAY